MTRVRAIAYTCNRHPADRVEEREREAEAKRGPSAPLASDNICRWQGRLPPGY